LSVTLNIVIIRSIGITAISWNSNIPKTFLPYSLFICPFSFNSFNTIAVEERASAAPIIIEDFTSIAKRLFAKNAKNHAVKNT